ncbi:phage integrase N-terminal SAM-like domain-containing protein [Aequorivita ciconiae]|uniref:phage integrase N-terminal SAM-like domain-containing protein n=1 Tax=Aequorivita ciconiae TaxID=2494375 RepID=UPI00196BA70D|nr:phage integrase N-terminal SAM-like domain-containing protein [Aequorivita sp. H23M31]
MISGFTTFRIGFNLILNIIKKNDTLIQRACISVPEFATLYQKLKRSVELAGKSQSTLTNYARCMAHIALHFNCSPLDLDEEQVLDYLHVLKSQHKSPSDILFKHTVYGSAMPTASSG